MAPTKEGELGGTYHTHTDTCIRNPDRRNLTKGRTVLIPWYHECWQRWMQCFALLSELMTNETIVKRMLTAYEHKKLV